MTASADRTPTLETVRPADEAALADVVRRAAAQGAPVYPFGGDTTRSLTLRVGQEPARSLTLRVGQENAAGRVGQENAAGRVGQQNAAGRAKQDTAHPVEQENAAARLGESGYEESGDGESGYEEAGYAVRLGTERLGRLVDHAADDMTITVEAGMTLADLGRLLAARGQRLPIDVCRPGEATVGGLVATNFHGPRRFAYGTVRDYVLGLRVVDGRGEVFSAGGRVVKNAAGYNLCRMLTGSHGTLGVITQATLMVRPAVETSAVVACDLDDLASAETRLAALVESRTRPVSIDLHAGRPRPGNPVFGPRLERSAARLFVGFEGSRPEVDWMVERLDEEWSAAEVRSPITAQHADAASLWRWLSEFPAQLRIAVRPSAVTETLAGLLELDPEATVEAHAGDGLIRAALGPTEPAEWAGLVTRRIRPLVDARGGRMVVLAAPEGAELSHQAVWGPESGRPAVSRAIKRQFDPHGILNPGRWGFDD